jgi:signal transduction histidine kinase
VTVSLTADAKFACLNVVDDGVGFVDVESARGAKRDRGLGIANMRERAEALGGLMDIKSALGKGTEIVAHVKLENGK